MPREDEEITSNFSESSPDFDVICNIVSILPVEYDVLSEISEGEEDFTEEMATHKTMCYYVMDNGVLENIEADQSYFWAGVNHNTKRNFDKQLANIAPCASSDIIYGDIDNAFSSMKLDENGFMWEREVVEEDVRKTRASVFDKVAGTKSYVFPKQPGEEVIPPTGWDDIDD